MAPSKTSSDFIAFRNEVSRREAMGATLLPSEDPFVLGICLLPRSNHGFWRTQPGMEQDKARREAYASSLPTLKYLACRWWKTSALTLASGSIMNPSVSCTPMSPGESKSKSNFWSVRLGQAG
jgi:hypothetical protein